MPKAEFRSASTTRGIKSQAYSFIDSRSSIRPSAPDVVHHPSPKMSSPSSSPSMDMKSFQAHLSSSTRILALLGAGLSASSGLPTFRGAGGLWRNYNAVALANPDAFRADPSLVWHFYGYRRHMSLSAKPNPAHYALAELAKRRKDFVTLSQNVDGLSPRAGHPAEQLKLLHGSLFDIKCSGRNCDYFETDNFVDPVVPALKIPTETAPALSTRPDGAGAADNMMAAMGQHVAQKDGKELDIANAATPLATVPASELPQCPKCKAALLRPGVVWFGEALPEAVLDAVENYLEAGSIDLIMVIGTSAKVYPAAGYIDAARENGARVSVGYMYPYDAAFLEKDDWFFEVEASRLVPEMLQEEIGDVWGQGKKWAPGTFEDGA